MLMGFRHHCQYLNRVKIPQIEKETVFSILGELQLDIEVVNETHLRMRRVVAIMFLRELLKG